MNDEFIKEILSLLKGKFRSKQIKKIEEALLLSLSNKKVMASETKSKIFTNDEIIIAFVNAKQVEGCSERTKKYYEITIKNALSSIDKIYYLINTDDIRNYLTKYQLKNNASKQTIDNVRRIISTFFSWLENEDYIIKSPVRRIKKIKIGKKVKEVLTDEMVEKIKAFCKNDRDLAIVNFLFSTGVRVGELVKINKKDIDFDSRECVVNGKGDKERKVYFDVKTKIAIQKYIANRKDNNDALFVSLVSPFQRLQISGVELMLRKIGRKIGIGRVHPHIFRRTIATKAIDKGMPIEQVQRMLGHTKIDTTLEYAMVDDSNVKMSHKKFLE